jgi:hypothetical protein
MGKPAQIDIVRRAYELWQQAGEPLLSGGESLPSGDFDLGELAGS